MDSSPGYFAQFYLDNVTLDKRAAIFCKHGWEEYGYFYFLYPFFPLSVFTSRNYRSYSCIMLI
jgi:hypothetical protein